MVIKWGGSSILAKSEKNQEADFADPEPANFLSGKAGPQSPRVGRLPSSAPLVDSLKIFEILKSASVPEDHARARTKAIPTAESEIALAVKTVVGQQFIAFRQTAFPTFATKAELSGQLAALESSLTHKLFAFWVGPWAVTVGLRLGFLQFHP